MAKPNYSFEKRQRDLAKKRKKEEKRKRKLEAKAQGTPPISPDTPAQESTESPDAASGNTESSS